MLAIPAPAAALMLPHHTLPIAPRPHPSSRQAWLQNQHAGHTGRQPAGVRPRDERGCGRGLPARAHRHAEVPGVRWGGGGQCAVPRLWGTAAEAWSGGWAACGQDANIVTSWRVSRYPGSAEGTVSPHVMSQPREHVRTRNGGRTSCSAALLWHRSDAAMCRAHHSAIVSSIAVRHVPLPPHLSRRPATRRC